VDRLAFLCLPHPRKDHFAHESPTDGADGADDQDDEFVELQNLTAQNQPLYDPAVPASTWRLRGGVDFDLPRGIVLGSGARLLLVSFNPTNLVTPAAFRTRYRVRLEITVLGPYSGKLDNSAETVRLRSPAHSSQISRSRTCW